MQNVSTPSSLAARSRGFRLSLSQKLGLLIAVIVSAAVAANVVLQLQVQRENAVNAFGSSNLQITSLVAQQISGGVRWNKPETILPAIEGLGQFENGALANAVVFDAQRKPILNFEGKRFAAHRELEQDFTAAREQRVKSGIPETYSDGTDHFIVMVPVTAGREKEYVGALALAFTIPECIQSSALP